MASSPIPPAAENTPKPRHGESTSSAGTGIRTSSYAVTGSASGIGAAVTGRLRAAGHSVIEVDLHDAGIVADLGTPEGRLAAATGVLERSGGVLDGAVLAAGIGPSPGPGRLRKIARINQPGTVELLTALRPPLAASGRVLTPCRISGRFLPGVTPLHQPRHATLSARRRRLC